MWSNILQLNYSLSTKSVCTMFSNKTRMCRPVIGWAWQCYLVCVHWWQNYCVRLWHWNSCAVRGMWCVGFKYLIDHTCKGANSLCMCSTWGMSGFVLRCVCWAAASKICFISLINPLVTEWAHRPGVCLDLSSDLRYIFIIDFIESTEKSRFMNVQLHIISSKIFLFLVMIYECKLLFTSEGL